MYELRVARYTYIHVALFVRMKTFNTKTNLKTMQHFVYAFNACS